MLSFTQFSKFSNVALISSIVLFVGTGCQPTEHTDNHEHEHMEADDATSNQVVHEEDELTMHEEHHHDNDEHEGEHANEMHHDEHEHDEHEEEEHDAHAGHNHNTNRISFDCEPEEHISVYYHDDSTPKTAHLLIDGIEYDLTEVSTLSEPTFTSPIGVEDGAGIVWQVTSDDAVLSQVPTSDITSNAALDNLTPLYTCHKEH